MRHAAVIFDLFGTLVPAVTTGRFRDSLPPVARALRADVDALIRLWVEDAEFMHWRFTRATSTVEAQRRTCGRLGISRGRAELARAAAVHLDTHRGWLRPRADALATLDALRSRGLGLALMSGCPSDVPELWDETPFAARFDAPLFSCREGLVKPDPRFYRRACDRLGVHPEACLYVGDAPDELVGAAEAGMTPVQLCDPGRPHPARGRSGGWSGTRIEWAAQVLEWLR